MKTKITHHQGTSYPQTVEVPAPLDIHPSVSPLAAELLMKTIKQLYSHPDSYNQQQPIRHGCSTPCCLLGHMAFFVGLIGQGCSSEPIHLTKAQFDSLFYYSEWPEQFFDRRYSMGTVPASLGAARAEHFLRTGE